MCLAPCAGNREGKITNHFVSADFQAQIGVGFNACKSTLLVPSHVLSYTWLLAPSHSSHGPLDRPEHRYYAAGTRFVHLCRRRGRISTRPLMDACVS